MKYLLLTVSLIFSLQAFAQYPTLSQEAEVSIITIGPGKYLYDCFGHNAIRIKDKSLGIDRAYNYGTYDAFDEGFYMRFTMGTTDYKLAVGDFNRFQRSYQLQNRWMKEQILDLTAAEKQQIFEYVQNNARPENAYYRYDPFFDNCATKLRDVAKDVLGDNLRFGADHIREESTIRQLKDAQAYNHPWVNFGIDIALGNVLDKTATPEEYMYLPDYVFEGYANATILREGQEKPLVKQTKQLISADYYEQPMETKQPWAIFSVVALLVMGITMMDYKRKGRTRGLDFALFFVSGLVGCLLFFLWFISSHATAVNNLNVLWAFFPNLFVAFVLLKKQPPVWARVYVRFLVILQIAMVISWVTLLQSFSLAMIPLMIMFTFRYVFLWQKGLVRAH